MAYRSNSFNVSPWQQRGQSFPMGSYSQGYNSYGGYAWNDSYSMSQMGRMAYDTPFRYGNERPGRNQMSPRRKPMHGKRLPQRSPASGPPSKRPNFGDKSKRRNEPKKRFSRSANKKNFRKQPKEETASDFEEYEILKTDEDDVEKEKEASAQKEETMEVNGIAEKKEGEEKKEEGKKEVPEKKEIKKFTACHICKVATVHPELLEEHMNTEEHKSKIDAAVAQYREKKGPEGAEPEKKPRKGKSDNWCTVCEMAFTGHFLSHRSTSEHRRIRDKKYPKCRPCSAGFSNAEEYKDHIKSEAHKQKSAEFYHFKKLPLGSDTDEAALEPVKIEEEDTKEDEVKVKEESKDEAMETDNAEAKTEDADKVEGDKEKKTDEKKEKKEAETTKKAEEKKPKTPSVIGLSFVVEVDGFYCKLCRKFFKDGGVAKKKHCYSVMHYEAYKQAMEIALKDEEERQKIAEINAKAEAEAAEAARLVAEIAAIQREARAAARKAANEKKTAQKATEQPKEELKDEGIEMSPADEQEKPAEVKQEPKDDTSLPDKKEQTEEMCT